MLPALVVAAVELSLLAWFATRGQLGHWVTHLLVGGLVALLAMTFWTRHRHHRVPHPAVMVAAGHLLASVPDLLVADDVQPGRWMDVFVFNVSAHHAPAGNFTWTVLAAAAALTYAQSARAVTAHERGLRRSRRRSRGP